LLKSFFNVFDVFMVITVKTTTVYNSFSFHQTVWLTGSYSCVAILIVGFML